MMYFAVFLMAIDSGLVTIIGGAIVVLGSVLTHFLSKRNKVADAQKTIAETEAIKTKKDIDLTDAAMKLAVSAGDQLQKVRENLDKAETRVSTLRDEMEKLENELREERHRANNLEQQLRFLTVELEETKARYHVNLGLLNKEIDRQRDEIELLKKPKNNG